MRIRFTDFLRNDKEEIGLYVKQEAEPNDFTILIKNGESKQIIFIRKMKNNWKILTKGVPEWVKSLKPKIVALIEFHWFVEIFMTGEAREKRRASSPAKFPGR